jgi:hypothetical protein
MIILFLDGVIRFSGWLLPGLPGASAPMGAFWRLSACQIIHARNRWCFGNCEFAEAREREWLAKARARAALPKKIHATRKMCDELRREAKGLAGR